MIHGHYFLTRRPDRLSSAFAAYWRQVHAPLTADIPQIRRYVQSLRVPTPPGDVFAGILSTYDAVDEFWLDSPAALAAAIQTDALLGKALPDMTNVVDIARTEAFFGRDHVMIDGAPPEGSIKGVWLLKRRPDMTPQAYRDHWLGPHADCIRALPGVRRYVQCHPLEDAEFGSARNWDGVVHIWFDDIAAMHAAFTGPEGALAVEDGPRLFDMDAMRFFHAREHVVVAAR